MQKSNSPVTNISRSSFQWILHQALVADERYMYCGLIGSASDNTSLVEKVAMIKDVADIKQTLTVWQGLDIQCLGFFHFEEEAPHADLAAAMPDNYLELKVCLSEKGRLDLLAFQCDKTSASVVKIDLDLIEDGQADAVD